MKEIDWTQAASPLNCPQCEYLLAEAKQLQKSSALSPVVDGLIILTYSCRSCDFRVTLQTRMPGISQTSPLIVPVREEIEAVVGKVAADRKNGSVAVKREAISLDELSDLCESSFSEMVTVRNFTLLRRTKRQPGAPKWINGVIVGQDPDSFRVSYYLMMKDNRESEICSVTLFPGDGEPDFEKVAAQLAREGDAIIRGPSDHIRVEIPKPAPGARVICPKCGSPKEMCGCVEMQPFLKDFKPGSGGSTTAQPGAMEDVPQTQFNSYLARHKSALVV